MLIKHDYWLGSAQRGITQLGRGWGGALLEGILHTSSWLERPQRTCRCICESVNGSSSVLKSVMTVNYRWPPLRWFWRAAAAYRRSVAPAVVTVADLRMLAVEGYTRIHEVCEWPCLWYNVGDASPLLKRTLKSNTAGQVHLHKRLGAALKHINSTGSAIKYIVNHDLRHFCTNPTNK